MQQHLNLLGPKLLIETPNGDKWYLYENIKFKINKNQEITETISADKIILNKLCPYQFKHEIDIKELIIKNTTGIWFDDNLYQSIWSKWPGVEMLYFFQLESDVLALKLLLG